MWGIFEFGLGGSGIYVLVVNMKQFVVLCLLPRLWRMQDMTECQYYIKAVLVHHSLKVPSAYLIAEGIRVWNHTLCPGLLSAGNEDRYHEIVNAACRTE